MKKQRWLFAALPALSLGVLFMTPSKAFDHRDSPQALNDPALDITDVYAFMRPNPAGDGGFLPSSHLVLVATFDPSAASGTPFPEALYQFHVRHLKDPTDLSSAGLAPSPDFRLVCSFANGKPQHVACSVNGTTVTADVTDIDAGDSDAGSPNDDVRIFAGLRADPAFADYSAFEATMDAGQLKFNKPGVNYFAGKTVRALVVEFNVNRIVLGLDASPSAPATAGLLTVSVESIR